MLVDVHEPPEIATSLKARGVDVDVVSLKNGDYAFSNVLVERKEWNDLLKSLNEGRLWKQVFNIKHSVERPVLLVEMTVFGHPDILALWKIKDARGQEIGKKVMGALSRIALMGVSVIVVPSREQLLDFLVYAYFSSDKSTPSFKPIPKKGERESLAEINEDMLCMIPGIGRKTAKEIMARVKNVHELSHLSQAELRQKIPGIGPKMADTIWKVLNDSKEIKEPPKVEPKKEEPKELPNPEPNESGVFSA